MKLQYNVLQIAIVIQQVLEILGQSGEWTQWGQWSSCSVTCGYGIQKRQKTWRSRDNVGSNDQAFVYQDIIECTTKRACPIDGSWGFWGPWSECTSMCDGGITIRKRECSAPTPQHGGLECEGKGEATLTCNDWACPDLPPDFDITQCNETTYMCLSREQCIPLANRCDNTLQCHDGSDEHDCFFYNWHNSNAAGTTCIHSLLSIVWTMLFIYNIVLRYHS
ncbi:Hemicentin-1 [Mactra antiquata]